ncbi:MAG: VanZ family protein [Bacteroidota bacterium]|nr:VanZ family protein [Bacteroidota bacterium]
MLHRNFKSYLWFQAPAILWAAAIFIESAIPGRKIPPLPHGFDKVVHVSLYFIFCWLAHRALKFQNVEWLSRISLFLAVVGTALYGFSDEYHQIFVPGRTADVYDLLADVLGASAYLLILAVAEKRKRGKKFNPTV